jgi:hypothetical protein
VRRFLPDLIQQIWDREIDPGKVFDRTLPLDQAAEGYKAMDERRATKVLRRSKARVSRLGRWSPSSIGNSVARPARLSSDGGDNDVCQGTP